MGSKVIERGYGRQAYRRGDGVTELYQAILDKDNKFIGLIMGEDKIEIMTKARDMGYRPFGKLF